MISVSCSISEVASGYIVDVEGNIDFPVLGKIKVAGMSRRELSEEIKGRLAKEGLVKDAVVTVQFQNN